MSTTTSTRTYTFSEFPNGKVNTAMLEAEIAVAALSVPLATSPQLTGSSAVLTFSGLLTAADITALNTVVAAHQGLDFSTTSEMADDLTETTNATTTWANKLATSIGPLPAGAYLISWSCEHDLLAEVAGVNSQARVTLNGWALNMDSWPHAVTHHFGGAVPYIAGAGDNFELAIGFRTNGASAATARMRRVHIAVAKIAG